MVEHKHTPKRSSCTCVYVTIPIHVARGRKMLRMQGFPVQDILGAYLLFKGANKNFAFSFFYFHVTLHAHMSLDIAWSSNNYKLAFFSSSLTTS